MLVINNLHSKQQPQ